MSKPKDECMSTPCHNKHYCRGLCTACYFETRRKIKAGEITDEELIRRRMIRKPNRTGRPSKNAMAKMLSKVLTGK